MIKKFLAKIAILCLPFIFHLLNMVGRQGFEPWKPMAADLQSAPVDHLGTCPFDQVGLVFLDKPSLSYIMEIR